MLSPMAGKTPEDSSGRIAELEAEVARLRDRLGTPDPPDHLVARSSDEGEEERLGRTLGAASRTKVIAAAVGIALLAFTAFFVVFLLMSSGLDRVARRAAKGFVPDEPPAPSASRNEQTVPDGRGRDRSGR